MANITQTIPALTAGISQQPDEQKIPGQVKDMVNALPDVTQGLLKRPAGKFVASLSDGSNNSTTNGKWFHYYRDENEQYIGQIRRSGVIKMWDCLTGAEKTVVNGIGNDTYLTHTGDEDLQTLTLNDFTYINNRTKTVEMDTATEPDLNFKKECFIELKTISYAKQYALNLFDDTTTQDVTTATRIKVERLHDSANSCNVNGVVFRKDVAGFASNHRFECGHDNGQSTKSNNILMRDALCPNTATEIFSGIGSGTTYFDKQEPKSHDSSVDQLNNWSVPNSDQKIITGDKFFNNNDDASGPIKAYIAVKDQTHNDYTVPRDTNATGSDDRWDIIATSKAHYNTGIREAHTVRVFPNSYTDEGRTVGNNFEIDNNVVNSAVTGRKNLSFRITTIGQSVADETTNTDSNIKYSGRYTTTHDLLHGGEGWQVGDHFYVWMANARYKITVDAISTSKVQANLGLVRPLPTSFDTETVVTAESILGDLRTEIIANERFLDTDVRQIGTGIYISQPPNATVTQVELENAVGNETTQSGTLTFRKDGHGLETGHRVQYKVTGGSAVSGLTADNYYYVIKKNLNKFYLATSFANANAGTKISSGALSAGITYSLPSGTHTFETGTFNASTPVGEQ